jgi:hypothetical protein
MRATIGAAVTVALLAGTVGLAGCNRSSSGSQSADSAASPAQGGVAYAGDRSSRSGGGGGGYDDQADRPPTPMFHGEPMWSENRRHTAKENAEYHFERAGQDLGAKTLDDFLTKVHRFGDHPPPGALKLTRANGDRLLYDPKSNVFAVFTRDGAPRTVFKPSNGMDYWREQKTREAEGDTGYSHRSYGGGGYGGERGGTGGAATGGGDEAN